MSMRFQNGTKRSFHLGPRKSDWHWKSSMRNVPGLDVLEASGWTFLRNQQWIEMIIGWPPLGSCRISPDVGQHGKPQSNRWYKCVRFRNRIIDPGGVHPLRTLSATAVQLRYLCQLTVLNVSMK